MVCRGFKPGAAGWQVQTKPQSYGGHRYVREHFIFMLDVTRRIKVFPIDDTFKDIGYYDNIIKMGHSRRLVLLFAIFFQTMQCIVFVILRKTNFGTEVALRHGGQFRYKVFEPCNDIPFRHLSLQIYSCHKYCAHLGQLLRHSWQSGHFRYQRTQI